MAVIKTSSIVSDIRGSVADVTYSRNRGGNYVKLRKGPALENSNDQLACQAAYKAVAQAWSGTLTEAQRQSWRDYAHAWPRRDRWGVRRLHGGFQRFFQANFTRRRLDVEIPFLEAPAAGPLHPPRFEFTANAAANTITVDLDVLADYPSFKHMHCVLYSGWPAPPGWNSYHGRWRYVGKNQYMFAWQFDPWTEDTPVPIDAGDKLWAKLVVQNQATGEISSAFEAHVLIA